MAGLWQRTGNVTVTNGSKTVTGFGTKWKTGTLPIQKGHTFYGPDNAAYEVDTVVSDESILLVDTYRGGTLANQAYRIDITRTSTISQFAADLASLVAKYRAWFDGMMTWLTGSGDVAILNPDTGANVTIPSWKKVASEGEGQTARAKTEADKAAASAALAGDIVAASALPLPDVWAPLSDSLRLITGYGREVKVGEDVVARMVNFSRSTTKSYESKDGLQKTATINEPAFGRGGCLVDGQSTNLIPISDFPQNLAGWVAPNATGNTHAYGSAPDGSNNAMKSVFSGDGLNRAIPELTDGVAYTFSFYAKNENSASVEFLVRIGGSSGSVVFQVPGNTPWRRYQVTQTYKEGDRSLRWYVNTKNVEIWLWGAQLEALPFATSYIPTNGAAATRVADVINIPYVGNGVPVSDMQMTMSAVISANLRKSDPTSLIDALDVVPNTGVFLTTSGQLETRIFGASWTPGFAPDLTKEQVVALSFNGATGDVALRVGDKIFTNSIVVQKGLLRSTGDIGLLCRSGTNARTGYGSVRDFKLWHKFFTANQLKAIK